MNPIIIKLSEKYKHAVFAKVDIDVDALRSVVDRYKVTTIPTFILVKDKVAIEQVYIYII